MPGYLNSTDFSEPVVGIRKGKEYIQRKIQSLKLENSKGSQHRADLKHLETLDHIKHIPWG